MDFVKAVVVISPFNGVPNPWIDAATFLKSKKPSAKNQEQKRGARGFFRSRSTFLHQLEKPQLYALWSFFD